MKFFNLENFVTFQLYVCLIPGNAWGVTAQLVRSILPKEQIVDLQWETTYLEIEPKVYGQKTQPEVVLNGILSKRKEWTLIWSSDWSLTISKDEQPFALVVPIQNDITPVELQAIGPMGEVEIEKIYLHASEWKTVLEQLQKKPPLRSFPTTALGYSFIQYEEDGSINLTLHALTGRISYQYLVFPPHWDLALNVFATFTPSTAKFVGANLRFGYVIPWITEPWSFRLLGGIAYLNMIVAGDSFGYHSLVYPQIYPILSKVFKNGTSAYVYLKYVFAGPNTPLLNFKEREIAMGGGWIYPLSSGHPIVLSIDVADLRIHIRSEHHTFSTSLNLGYGW